MAKPELTKKLIADTLKKLALKKHIDKISISEIVEEAEINRQTFYYHFRDKQKLIGWIFDSEVAMLTDNYKTHTILKDIVQYLYSQKSFYKAALTSEVQNNLREHLFNFCYQRCKSDLLSLMANRKMDEKALNLLVRFFSNAIVGSLVQWAMEGMETNDRQFLNELTPILKAQYISAIEYQTGKTKKKLIS